MNIGDYMKQTKELKQQMNNLLKSYNEIDATFQNIKIERINIQKTLFYEIDKILTKIYNSKDVRYSRRLISDAEEYKLLLFSINGFQTNLLLEFGIDDYYDCLQSYMIIKIKHGFELIDVYYFTKNTNSEKVFLKQMTQLVEKHLSIV